MKPITRDAVSPVSCHQLEIIFTVRNETPVARGHRSSVASSSRFLGCLKKKFIIILSFIFQELLEQLFKLFDQERNQYLLQENWIEFLKQRLT